MGSNLPEADFRPASAGGTEDRASRVNWRGGGMQGQSLAWQMRRE